MHKPKNLILSALFLLCLPLPAFAYVDPGTGGMLLQSILAVFASLIFYFRNPSQLYRDIKFWFSKKSDLNSHK